MKAVIEIAMDNAAFAETPATELSRILRKLARNVERGWLEDTLYDINGNVVGKFKITGGKS